MCGENGAILFNTYQASRKQYAYSSFVILCMIINGMDLGVKLIEFYLERFGSMGFGTYKDLLFSFESKKIRYYRKAH